MSTTITHSCDMCGRTAALQDNGITGWLTIQQRKDRAADDIFGRWGWGGLSNVAEACSWDCLAKYASARILVDGTSQ